MIITARRSDAHLLMRCGYILERKTNRLDDKAGSSKLLAENELLSQKGAAEA